MSGQDRNWGYALLELHRIWCEAMDKARADGMSEDDAAEAVGAWMTSNLMPRVAAIRAEEVQP